MSEVLSESEARPEDRPEIQRSDRFTLFPADERQSLRLGRFLMAGGSSLLIILALGLFAFLGLLPWRAAVEGAAGIVTLIALFFLVFRSGFNLRFADPSLSTEQVGAAIVFLAYIMYHAGPARSPLMLFYLVAMLFGVLRLNAKRLMVLAAVAIVAHGTVLHLTYLRNPSMDVRAAFTEFGVLVIVLPWFAVMGGYVNRLRVRLSDSNRELRRAFDHIGELAIRDELTAAFNRRFLIDTLARERSRAERTHEAFSICLADLDHFKAINDTLGHAAGDSVLKHFAALAPRGLRGIDTFGRFGGEEFLLVLPGTDRQGALAVAERVRAATEASALPDLPFERRITISIGVATYERGEEVSTLLARADQALYQAKNAGRNRVIALG
ncbi:MAG TPA: GGDEF domain-containing protein [Burkholderiales bacterium]|nr:GGDEF domain-containing protein [Burkholderiales bacterium]